MSKGGGGGYDTSAMEAATREATALQKQIYEEGKELAQPWYQTGTSAIGRLADLMGISGGSVKSREQLVKELTPQYTKTITPSAMTAALPDAKGDVTKYTGLAGANAFYRDLTPEQQAYVAALRPDIAAGGPGRSNNYAGTPYTADTIKAMLGGMPQAPSTSVDSAALNKAVEEAIAAQGTRPEGYGSLAKSFGMEDYQADPGYQFRLSEGNKAIERALAARGKTFTPEAVKSLTGYGQGLASEEYGNAFNRYNINQDSLFNRLATLSGMGQTSTGQLAAGGQNYATNVGNLTTNLANAQTAAQVAKASRPSMFSQLLSTGAQVAGAYFSDKLLKENIELVDTVDGIERYRFNYKGDDKVYIGALAQQVQDVKPEAVSVADNGYLMVDYSLLPFKMEAAQ